MSWLNFEKQEKGFKPFKLTRESIKENVGKTIVYLTKRDIDSHRGYAFQKFDVIKDGRYNQIIFQGDDSIYIKDIIECGIKIENDETPTNK